MTAYTMWETTRAFFAMVGIAVVCLSVAAMFVRDRH